MCFFLRCFHFLYNFWYRINVCLRNLAHVGAGLLFLQKYRLRLGCRHILGHMPRLLRLQLPFELTRTAYFFIYHICFSAYGLWFCLLLRFSLLTCMLFDKASLDLPASALAWQTWYVRDVGTSALRGFLTLRCFRFRWFIHCESNDLSIVRAKLSSFTLDRQIPNVRFFFQKVRLFVCEPMIIRTGF